MDRKKNNKQKSAAKNKNINSVKKEKAKARKRKFLDNMTVEQKDLKKAKDREYYRRKKSEGKTKSINDMSEREKRKHRKMWRANSKKYRQKKSSACTLNNTLPENESINTALSQLRRNSGRKIVRKDRAKAYRTIEKKNIKIKQMERKLHSLREKIKKKDRIIEETRSENGIQSPKRKVNSLVQNFHGTPEVQKKLLFCEALSTQLEDNAKNFQKNTKEREAFQKCVSGVILKRYRLQHMATKFLPTNKDNKNILKSSRKTPTVVVTPKVREKIIKFFESDEVSRMCPGKRDYVIKNRAKKQKRILLDTVNKLHPKFVEQTGIKMSYPTLLRQKPFWVVSPSWRDRDTCLCVKHENFKYIINKLNSLKQLNGRSISELLREYSCDVTSYDCMFGTCMACKDINMDLVANEDRVTYFQWQTTREDRVIKGQEKEVRITKKISVTSTVQELKGTLARSIPEMKKHVYGIYANNKEKREVKEKLKKNEIMMQIDFSENYVTKYGQEIQSTHFGASKVQLSIHTGVYYAKDHEDTTQTFSFATVSDNLDHQAHAVWAHVKPVLQKILNGREDVDTLHIFSDGPTSQYRNRNNVHLWLQTLIHDFQKITTANWTFSEPGHGKGPMDGIGGVLKRTADKHVLMGKDIRNSEDFVNLFSDSTVLVHQIAYDDIEFAKKLIPKKVDAISGIMTITKITWQKTSQFSIKLYQNDRFQKEITLKMLASYRNNLLKTSMSSDGSMYWNKEVPIAQNLDVRQSIYQTVYSSSSSDEDDLPISTRLRDARKKYISRGGSS